MATLLLNWGVVRGEREVHAENRHQAILRKLREEGSLRVSDFAAELGVSPVTVRRDVEILADRGLVARVHGGAMLPDTWAETAPTGTAPGARASGAGTPGAGAAGRQRVIGLIVPSADYYYPEVIKGAREAAAAHNLRLVLDISGYDAGEERTQVERMIGDGVDGLLVVPSGPRGWYEELPVPVVIVERRPEADEVAGIDHVLSDHVHGARLAVRHLAEAGRRHLVLLVRGTSPTAQWIIEGFEAGVRAAGLEAPRTTSVLDLGDAGHGSPEYDTPVEALLDAAAEGRVDAVIAHPDNEALALLRRLRARSIPVPGKVAIVSYDDEVAGLADIPLSAIAPAKREVGAAAVELVVRRLDQPDAPRHRLFVLPQLRARSSSGG
ncbi:substrate-binding domain-containing protein [Streptomyces sp. P9(2023)]|uniref:substrate-binding domain-containing protein n=1 Tax=Streptomyces sp. P9(2023) TaxID=3064394 RepID=UPI0028F4004E|nr:substrate-binding domain-containing protein [Streptomyces sp. P9(2023)]MDT9686957.1 substrate-binding domain-containing protein [Streptomyces sp. P9(2023)]